MLELLAPAMSITTAALLARSSLRAWRAENKFFKWGGTVLAALFSAAVSLIKLIMVVGLVKLRARSATTLDLKVAGTPEQYGEYILSYQDCSGGHGDQLTGGVPRRLAPLGPDLNLVKGWKFEEFVTTMRTGVDPIAKLVRAFGADPVAR